MERKPRSSFLKLLSEPGFDFSPYFDKAVIEWLERNIGDFLEKAPQACIYFTQEEEYQAMVAANIQLIPENEKLIDKFMKEMNTGWQSTSAMEYIAPRLIAAGKADTITLAASALNAMYGQTITNVINAISDEGVRQLFEKINLGRTRWDSNNRCTFMKRLPSDLLIQLTPDTWEWCEKNTRPRALSTMATKWPIGNIAEFLQKYGSKYPSLSCMNCGDKVAKSKPGYTLHRKTCDPHNEYPNIWTIIAGRTMDGNAI